jgi:hypothetical protein
MIQWVIWTGMTVVVVVVPSRGVPRRRRMRMLRRAHDLPLALAAALVAVRSQLACPENSLVNEELRKLV